MRKATFSTGPAMALVAVFAIGSLHLVDARASMPVDPAIAAPETRPKPPVPARPAMSDWGKASQALADWQRNNRASRIIGTSVRDHEGQRLGEIADIVLDVPNGTISYAVIVKGGFLGLGARYHAVPWNALILAPGERHMVIDMSLDELRAAPRVETSAFLDVNEVQWGSQIGPNDPGIAAGDARPAAN